MRPHQMPGPPPPREAPSPGAVSGDLAGPFEMTLPAALDAPAAARVALRDWMAGRVSDAMLADAQLLVSELVANSVLHAGLDAGELVRVGVAVSDGVLRLEVENPGSTGTIAAHEPDLERGGGFGLHVVEVLSRRWGVDRNAGTRVWAELAFSAAG